MVDTISKARRSWNMGQVRSKNTKPELLVRSLLHNHGFRFRLHRKNLPGKPDIVLPKYKVVVFVHGCFWHQHLNCLDATVPKTRTEFWMLKFSENRERDKKNQVALHKFGWHVLVVWECETIDSDNLINRLCAEIKSLSETLH